MFLTLFSEIYNFIDKNDYNSSTHNIHTLNIKYTLDFTEQICVLKPSNNLRYILHYR